ncbi:hypothetical protein BASA81_017879 [Batrachochytrium salamandrivorans]|nr:hypothetical protein BASA81_017879 [Batrachochytrium salamandrivorans]
MSSGSHSICSMITSIISLSRRFLVVSHRLFFDAERNTKPARDQVDLASLRVLLTTFNPSNINRSIPNTQSLHTSITSTPTTIPITPTISEIRHQRSKYASNVHSKSGASPNWPAAMCRQTTRQVQNFCARRPQYWPGHRASLLSLARCDGLWDYPRALKAGLSPHSNRP